jgi:hypothetical protein
MRMRVLLRDLPVWMTDIIEPAIVAESRLELVTVPSEVGSLRDVVAFTQPDVLVTGSGDPHDPYRGFAALLYEFPSLRVFSIGGTGGGAENVEVMMVPTQIALGDISLDGLVHMIAGGTDAAVVPLQPTRHVPAD